MQIVALDTDAWPEVQEENQFNDPPEEGDRYVMWTIEVENVRGSVDEYEDISYYDFEVVGEKNAVTYSPFSDGCGVIPDPLGDLLGAKLYKGGETSGNVCFSVPTDETGLTFLYDDSHDDAAGESFSVEVWFKGLPD